MSHLDEYLARAGDGAVLMVSPVALDDIRLNTDPRDWSNDLTRYRNARIEEHDE